MRIYNYIFEINKILIISFPFLLILGSFLSDLACIIIGVTFFLYCCKISNFTEYKNYIIYFFLLIYIYLNINSFFSFIPKISFQTSLSYIRIILFIVALSFFLRTDKKIKYYLFLSFFICLLLLLIDSFFQLFTGNNLLGMEIKGQRISSFFGDKLIMGSYVSRLLPFIIALIFINDLKKKNFFVIIILLISGALVILSNERLAFVYYLLFCIYYFFLHFNKKLFFTYIFSVIFLILVLIFFKPHIFQRIFIHTFNQYNETKNIFAFSYRHKTHFQTAYNMFLDKKLLGHGLKSFRILCSDQKYTVRKEIYNKYGIISPADGILNKFDIGETVIFYVTTNVGDIYKIILKEYFPINTQYFVSDNEYVQKGQLLVSSPEYVDGCNTHPHNIYLQFLSELGFLGFVFFAIFFTYVLYQVIKAIFLNYTKKLTNIYKCKTFVLFGIFLSMIPVLPSGNYFNNWLLICTYFPIGFYLSLRKFNK